MEHSELTGLYWITKLSTNQTWPVYRNIDTLHNNYLLIHCILESCEADAATFTEGVRTG